ncbi:hypothetical protein [Nitrospirillum sp. BR 11163]|uniref:hypothetical protein n=1 Tax=Nitrospirillum sp. BR 11163 TaxID=3104323 RepID=UPI002AFDEB19|nr:hypothetical protein [Nitrospirillum sp. BR 11163]MEA1673445.1 hypothetical protein [Nitrospirillum sp. BR 11163]
MTADPAESPSNSLQSLWQSQEQEIPPVTLEEIRAKAAAFERKIRRRNLRKYLGSAVAAACFAFYIWLFPGWMIKLGSALIILALGWTMWRLRQRGDARIPGGTPGRWSTPTATPWSASTRGWPPSGAATFPCSCRVWP